MRKVLFYLILLVLLTGCGGGGGSSSSGGGGDIAQYVGTYTGTAIITVKAFGQTASQSLPITITIANDGTVNVGVSGGPIAVSAQCNSTSPPPVINGNSYSTNINATCTEPNLGTCTVTGTDSGSVANSAISGTVSLTYTCTAGTFPATITYTATKTLTAQSFSALRTGGTVYNYAIDILSRNQ